MSYIHPKLGTHIKLNNNLIPDVETPNKWITKGLVSYLNPMYSLSEEQEFVYRWIAIMLESRQSCSASAMVKLLLEHRVPTMSLLHAELSGK